MKSRIRILTDIERLPRQDCPDSVITQIRFSKGIRSLSGIFRIFLLSGFYDYVVLDFSSYGLLLGLLKFLIPINRCKLVFLDLFVPHPNCIVTTYDKFRMYVVKLCLKGVDIIFLYSKSNALLLSTYQIEESKLRYLPFKINSYDFVISRKPADLGYIFSGGRSRRDFATLIEACRGMPFPVRIVTPREEIVELTCSVPQNVQFIHDDGSIESFVSWIANARLVVIPTKRTDFASTGTSVYLISMALGKCVVISSGPTTDGILTPDLAVIIPPEDANALRRAIEKTYNDDTYRNSIAQAGREYALSLGDESSFYSSLVGELVMDATRT
jgi:glycosyltransferase involved in cell wall biosynthesis